MAENTAAETQMGVPVNGEFSWTEIATDNLEASKNFYAEIFGWKFKESGSTDEDFRYLVFGTKTRKQFGGLFEMKPEFYGGTLPKPHMNIYVKVADVDETASRAFELGGTILSPPMDVPNVGRMCQIEDPTGAKLIIITLES